MRIRMLLAWFLPALCLPQVPEKLTIERCYELARANYPQLRRLELVERTAAFNIENAGKGYLPA